MENTNKMTENEVTDLRKALTDLDMGQDEIDEYIEKAKTAKEENTEIVTKEGDKGKEVESSTEETMEEKAAGGEKKVEEVEPKAVKEKEEIEKGGAEDEDLEKACGNLKMKKAEIEKSIEALELKMGKKKEEKIEKSIESDLHKEPEFDIEKAFGERFASMEIDIVKSITDKFEDQFDAQNEIIKGLKDDLKKIGDTPIGTKAVRTSVKFFEKGMSDDLNDNEEEQTLSIYQNRDEILKGLQDDMSKEKDPDLKQAIEDGISDLTVNRTPTKHGITALTNYAKKHNIVLER